MMMRAIRLWLCVVLLLAAAPAVAQDHPLKGIALVIGESDYVTLAKLDNPKRDARAMDDMLDQLGFTVDRVLDGDAAKLRAEIAAFVDEAKDADVALVYYSGHGIEADGADFMVPTDTDLATPQAAGKSLVPVSDLLEELAKTVPVTIVLLDACRTNSFPPGALVQLPGDDKPVEVASSGLEAVRGPVPVAKAKVSPDSLGMVIGFSASPGEPALDGEPDGNSPYAAALLKHLAAGGYSFGDLMTLVGEEVYLKTKARQLPWVNSSLRRVLQFGKPIEVPGTDEQSIRDGRRQLLLTIAGEPDATRRYVETVAEQEGVPLDALYGMLKVLGVDTSADQASLEKQLLEGAEKLKQFMAERPGNAATDVDLVRLSALADQAQTEGAIDLALKFRAQASKRADEISGKLDVTEANLKQDRLQLGQTYAQHARTAELNFDFATAATMWGKAFDQVAKWDDDLALGYKLGEGGALLADGQHQGDVEALNKAVAAYGAAEKLTDNQTDDWARVHLALGGAYDALGFLKQDAKLLERAGKTDAEVRKYYDRSGGSDDAIRQTMQAYGIALLHLSDVTQSADALQQAADALSDAVDQSDRSAAPLQWAEAQSRLGLALQTLGTLKSDAAVLDRAIVAQRAALEVMTRERTPLAWGTLMAELGASLADLGQKRRDGMVENLTAGVDALQSALEELTRARAPRDWANAESQLGLALGARGVVTKSMEDFNTAVVALQAALEVQTREKVPHDWAMAMRNLGLVQRNIADAGTDPAAYDPAIANLQAAAEQLKTEDTPVDWAQTLYYLGNAALSRGNLTGDIADLKLAQQAYTDALPELRQMNPRVAKIVADALDQINGILSR